MSSQFRPPLRPHADCRARVERIGQEQAPVIVVDNFIDDPQHLIDYAAAVSTFQMSREIYPGTRAPVPMPYPLAAWSLLRDLILETFGLGEMEPVDCRSDFSILAKPPEAVSVRKRLPHTDTSDPNFVVLLHYLCRGSFGGTSFYRHRATGFEIVDGGRRPAYEAAVERELAAEIPTAYMNGSTEHYERIANFAPAFNRVIVYRSISLHSADVAPDARFDPSPRTGRLTANTSLRFGPPERIRLSPSKPAMPDWGWLPALGRK